MSVFKKDFFKEIFFALKYALVGLGNTLFTASIIFVLSFTSIGLELYTAIGYLCGIVLSSFLHLNFTFKQNHIENRTKALIQFIVVAVCLLGLVQLLQQIFLHHWKWSESLTVIAGMLCYSGIGFLINRTIIFRDRKTTNEQIT